MKKFSWLGIICIIVLAFWIMLTSARITVIEEKVKALTTQVQELKKE